MSGIVAAFGARGQKATNVRQPVSFTFDEIVALFDPSVVSYWKFQSIVAAVSPDEKGIANATITGSPEQNIPTIVKRDTSSDGAPTDGTCIAWQRVLGEYAQAAHNAAHKTASGTIVVYFQRDTGTVEKSQLVEADVSGPVGGMAIGINTNGAPDAYIRGVGGTAVVITGGFNDVLIDRAYTLIFRWGPPQMSLSLWDDTGFMIRRNTNPSTIGLSGTSTIRFGATHAVPDSNHHDGPYGRVIWMNRRITDNEEIVLAQAKSVVHSVDLYRGLELGMGPISLWGMGELAGTTIQDAVSVLGGPRPGTFSGVIGYNSPDLPQNSINGAINFGAGTPATGSGTVPHSSAFILTAYTLSFWFNPNIVPGEGDPALPLVNKCGSSATAGDFACFLASGNGDVLRVRVRGNLATDVFDISTPGDTVHVGQRYHVLIRANNTGVSLYLNGKFIGKVTEHTIGWPAFNTQPLQFAWGANFAGVGDCILDEICLFNRTVTDSELAALAQRTDLPVAVANSATVIESTVDNVIDVIGNDTYVGLPTIEVVTPPAGGDTAVPVNAAGELPFIHYTAGAVGAGGASRSFQYRLTDFNGTSNTVTCPVTVQDTGFVPTSIANCYTHATSGSGTTANVNTMGELEAAIDAAVPGTQIIVAGGTYTGGTRTFNPQGTTANPIVVRPADAPPNHGRGTVIINEAIWTLAANSARLVITNLHFNNSQININGQHHRVARCQFRDMNRYAVRVLVATDTRISHCDFAGYRPTTQVDKGAVEFDDVSIRTGALNRALLDYCHMHDITQTANQDPSNVVKIGSAGGTWPSKAGVILDHCFINNISRFGSGEFIVCKTSEVTIRYCTFTNMDPGGVFSPQDLRQRQGSGIEVRSCWFGVHLNIWDDVNVSARRPLIIGNHMTGGFDIHCRAGNDQPGQTGNFSPGPYHHCEDGRFIGNVLESGNIIVGNNPTSPSVPLGNFYPARDNNVVLSPPVAGTNPRRNIRNAGGAVCTFQNDVNTTHVDDTAADNDGNSPPTFTPAEQLNANDVGVQAPDPLCPSGPQN